MSPPVAVACCSPERFRYTELPDHRRAPAHNSFVTASPPAPPTAPGSAERRTITPARRSGMAFAQNTFAAVAWRRPPTLLEIRSDAAKGLALAAGDKGAYAPGRQLGFNDQNAILGSNPLDACACGTGCVSDFQVALCVQGTIEAISISPRSGASGLSRLVFSGFGIRCEI